MAFVVLPEKINKNDADRLCKMIQATVLEELPTTPTNSEAVAGDIDVTHSDWEREFDDRYPVTLWLRETMLDPETWLTDIKQFIRQTHLDLLGEVQELIRQYDSSPDNMAGYEIRIVRAVEFREKLSHIIKRVEGGQQ